MGDMLSQNEIEALLGNNEPSGVEDGDITLPLSDEDKSILEKLGLETMEVLANTLSKILFQESKIGKPDLKCIPISEMTAKIGIPYIGVLIEYTTGIVGSNILLLTHKDGKAIADLMMGGTGKSDSDELTDLDKSAVGEAMNQSVGAMCNLYFKILGEKVDINTPRIIQVTPEILEEEKDILLKELGFNEDKMVIVLEYDFKVGDVVDSKIVSIMPSDFARRLKEKYEAEEILANNEGEKTVNEQVKPTPKPSPVSSSVQQGGINKGTISSSGSINAQPVEFQEFSFSELRQQKENIDLIMDVPLEVTVEMGRTVKRIEEILEFSPGTIIELNKLAGDPIDIVINGKFVAKGEVVVIDENYGIRITEIVNVNRRI
ncbi:MAG: flagellar motor switch phosphatase FliY [Lachnospirales bacterium]